MAEVKLYEELAKETLVAINEHKEATKKVADAVQKISTDRRYTDEGKQQLIDGLRNQLKENNQTYTEKLKNIINLFLKKYQVTPVDDAVDSQEVANSLKIIEMCGFSLTSDALRAAIDPLKDSFTSLKMIHSVIHAKGYNAVTYKPEVFNLIDEYMGMNDELFRYTEIIDEIKLMLDMPELVSTGLHGSTTVQSSVINEIYDSTPFCTMCLGDNMMNVGKMYESLRLEYPRMFK